MENYTLKSNIQKKQTNIIQLKTKIMPKLKTLLEQLRPEIIEALEENRGEYDFSITDLYNELDNLYLYRQLSIGRLRDIILYADVNEYDWGTIDWKYGDKLLAPEKRN